MQKRRGSVLLFLLFTFFPGCFQSYKIPPTIEKGILDLKNWDLKTDGIIPLNGEWEFYYGKLYTSQDFKNLSIIPKYLDSPSSWDDHGFPLEGYATFRIRILNIKNPQIIGFKIPHMNSSYRLFVNGKLIASNGVVSSNPNLYIPQHLPLIKVYLLEQNTIEMILQIANYSDNISGIWESIEVGTEEQIIRKFWASIGTEIFFLGVIFIIGIYHLSLYLFRNSEKASLYFGLFCLIMGIRIIVTGEKLLLQIFPSFPWEIHIKMEYLSIYMALPVFSYFLFFTFNRESVEIFRKNRFHLSPFLKEDFYYPIIHFISFVSLPFILVTIFTKARFFSEFLSLYQIFIIFVISYIFYSLILASMRKKEGAYFSLTGSFAPIITTINDILYAKRLIQSAYILPIGIFIFILFQSLALAFKFSKAFNKIEDLTKHLKQLLKSFERFVPKEFLHFLNKQDITQVHLGDQIQRKMTIMFSDIRNFTKLSEKLTPEENFTFINEYLSHIEPLIEHHYGFIDKYLGDGFMALFAESTDYAIQASIEIQKKLKELNHNLTKKEIEPIRIGIGIHFGILMLGVVGSSNRMETTVISDAVNTTSRLERLNRDFGTDIIISEEVLERTTNKENFKYRYLGTILLKGKSIPIKIYEIYNHYHESIIDEYEKTKEKFYQGIAYYTRNEMEKALNIFNEIVSINPYDHPARYYQFRCRSIIGF